MKIPKIDKDEFLKRLKRRKYEDVELVRMIEDFFLEKRGYVFKMPKKGESVILLTSGGLDSTVSWAVLLNLGFQVYPLFLRRHIKNKTQEKSLDFFSSYFKKRFPKLFVPPTKWTAYTMPPEMGKVFRNGVYLHPQRLLEYLDLESGKIKPSLTRTLSTSICPFFGVLYAMYLRDHYNVAVKTILSGIVTEDGVINPPQSFTAQRAIMLDICIAAADFSWQYASFACEKELGHWLKKADLIRLGNSLGLPLEKTRSCNKNTRHHCGRCLGCSYRKESFAKAGIKDPTQYGPKVSFKKLKLSLKSLLEKHTLTKRLLDCYFRLKKEVKRDEKEI